MKLSYSILGNGIDDSFYGVTDSVRNTVLNNEQWTYYTDRNGLGDIIQKSNETEAHLFEYRSDKKLKKFTLLKNNTETQVNYFYDGLGRRIAKLVNTPTESFTNTYAYEADQDKIILGKSGQGDETLYIDGQGIDEHLTKVNANEVKPYIVNHLGTVLNSDAADSTRATGAFGELFTDDGKAIGVYRTRLGKQIDLEQSNEYNIIHASRLVGRLHYSIKKQSLMTHFLNDIWILFAVIIVLSLLLFVYFQKYFKPTLDGFKRISQILKTSTQESITSLREFSNPIKEVKEIAQRLEESFTQVIEGEEVRMKHEVLKESKRLFRVFKHDSGGQIAAIRAVASDSPELDEKKRITLRNALDCIEDSINHIENSMDGKKEDLSIKPQLVSSALESVVSSLRYTNRNFIELDIEFNLNKKAYGHFAKFDKTTFNRCISNIVNNAIEATDKKGKIKVSLTGDSNRIKISISDNGKGISESGLQKIRGILFGGSEEVFSTKGSGLGLTQVRDALQRWSGHIEIESVVNQGTNVDIILQRCPPHKTFISSLKFSPSARIVVIDDDPLIHQIIDTRFEDLDLKENVLHFSTARQFENFMLTDKEALLDTFFLFDNELIDRESETEKNQARDEMLTGLDLIKKYNLAEQSILVTSTHGDEKVALECLKIGLKILPKNLANFIPIEKIDSSEKRVVFIDDTPFNHYFWEMSAEKNNIKLDRFFDIDEFKLFSHFYNKKSLLFIDSQLGEDLLGEEESQELANMGFSELYVHSGNISTVKKTEHLKGVIDKVPPFKQSWVREALEL
jgi:signal transduction histidine kinase